MFSRMTLRVKKHITLDTNAPMPDLNVAETVTRPQLVPRSLKSRRLSDGQQCKQTRRGKRVSEGVLVVELVDAGVQRAACRAEPLSICQIGK